MESITEIAPMQVESSSASVYVVEGNAEHDNYNAIVLVERQEPTYEIMVSPNCTRYYIPICNEDLKPKEGKLFETMEEAEKAYTYYAFAAGFDVRKGATYQRHGVIKLKYLICNRQGHHQRRSNDRIRKRMSARIGCNAKIIFKHVDNKGYKVHALEEKHTHPLIRDLDKVHMKRNRQMHEQHQAFIMDCGRQRIEPAKSYNLFQQIVGGYSNVGASKIDFKNHRRDMLAYFKGSDAQVVIERFFQKKEMSSANYFAYDVDEENHLNKLFWCDAVSRKNYTYFGDIVSFDSTYNTNRYQMVFSPFTGYDHHKSLVLFGVALIMNENAVSFEWVFQNFKKAMGGAPRVFITDQDPAMKIVVESVFPDTRHMLCMWHIMEKVSGKVEVTPRNEYNEFRRRLAHIVWDQEKTPPDFEREWKSLMIEFNLTNYSWLTELYELREKWIPAYFRDVKLSGLVKTTSISECMNSFFRKFFNCASNLIEFMLYYESAIESQRHTQGKKNYDNELLEPDLISLWALEKNASKVYTLNMFKLLQVELKVVLYDCRLVSIVEDEYFGMYTLKEQNGRVYMVEHKIEGGDWEYSCNLFIRIGLPCRHILMALKNLQFEKLPDNLVLTRWTKEATLSSVFTIDNVIVNQLTGDEGQKLRLSNTISGFHSCLDIVKENPELIEHLAATLRREKQELLQAAPTTTSSSTKKSTMFDKLAGVKRPESVEVQDPKQAKTKGSGKRLKSGKEKSIQMHKKGRNMCFVCHEYAPHNSRTCPWR